MPAAVLDSIRPSRRNLALSSPKHNPVNWCGCWARLILKKETVMAENSPPMPPPGRGKRLTTRERGALIVLGVFALVALLLGRPVRHHVLSALVLHFDAPSEAVLTEMIEGTSNPAPFLERIWRAGSFSGRSFVVSYLQRRQSSAAALVRPMEPVLEEAVWDANLETREAAFSVMGQQQNPSLRRWLREQASDADPAVRVLAVQQLARVANSNDVPSAMRLLDDPDPRVVAATGSVLKRVTGQDFGLKTAQALPRFAWKADAPPLPVDWDTIQRGREGWRTWWRLHQSEFPADNNPPTSERHTHLRPTPDFALDDLEGRRVRLSDFRGQAVLLTFWNLTNQFSVVDEPVRQTLLQSPRLTVLTIAVAAAVWPEASCGDHEGGHGDSHSEGHEDHGAHCHTTALDLAKTKADARDLAARLGVKHPVLLDTKAGLVTRYGVEDLPAYVLVDAQGNLRRRVVGSRSETVFRAMLDEVTSFTIAPATAGR